MVKNLLACIDLGLALLTSMSVLFIVALLNVTAPYQVEVLNTLWILEFE